MINISGLAIGLACCIVIGIYVYHELHYDRLHPAQDLYRVTEIQEQAGNLYTVAVTPGVLAKELKNDFPAIEQTCRVGRFWQAPVFASKEKNIEPGQILIVDNAFFKMFHFPFLYGDPKSSLLEPDDVVLTEKTAESLFGSDWRNKNIVGKEITLNKDRVLNIVAIAYNPPENSHLQFDALLSMKHEEKNSAGNFDWNSNNFHTYIDLRSDTDLSSLKTSLFRYLDQFDKEMKTTLHLQPVQDIYLHSDFAFHTDWSKHSNFLYIKIFVAVGSIVLLIAVFNFVNICTARAVNRAKEVGVRKVVGAVKKQLVMQFLCETFMMTVFAVLLALFMVQLFLPFLNELSQKSLSLALDNGLFLLVLAGSILTLTVIAGLYPAFYLSSFRPAKVLKGYASSEPAKFFRMSLVVMQFTFSIILIVGSIVIHNQLHFLQNKNLGFDKDHLIDVALKNDLRWNSTLLKQDLLNESSISAVTVTSSNMIGNTSSTGSTGWEGMRSNDKVLLTHMNVDADFLPTTRITLAAGRNFNHAISSDTVAAYILNVSAAKRMGYTAESAIGKKIKFQDVDGYVIGVVNDFHFQAMNTLIEPILLRNWPSSWVTTMLVRARGNNVREAISAIESAYKKHEPNTGLSFQFLDQALQNQYRLEQNTGKIVLFFSGLAIVVSCLGLFGLAMHTAMQRTKEVGIRKVLGASVGNIVSLLSADLVKLVIVAVIIATPIGWWSMDQWVKSFAYKTPIEWWVFASAAVLVLFVALITVSFQSVRAALGNTVDALRTE